MKKSLIALAVASAFAAPAFAATSNVDVYGVLNVAIQDTDVDNSDIQVTDNFSRIGFKGSEDLGGGLKAVWQIESQLSAGGQDGVGGTQALAGRNTFVGLAGGFGTVLMGRHDTPYKLGTLPLDIFADTIADYNLGRLDGVDLVNGVHDYRSPDAIAYISPTWSGFHFAGAIISTNSAANLNSDDPVDAYSLTAVYSSGPLFVSGSYQNVELGTEAMKIGAGFTFGDMGSVNGIYESVENDNAPDRDSWLVNGKFNMGPMSFKAQYGQVDWDGSNDGDQWAVGFDYSMSKRTTAYAVYGVGDNDVNDSVAGWNVGLKHSF